MENYLIVSLWSKEKKKASETPSICWKLKVVKQRFVSKCRHITIKETDLCSNLLVLTVNSATFKCFSARQDSTWKATVMHKRKIRVWCVDSQASFFGLRCAEGWGCSTTLLLAITLLKILYWSKKQPHWTICPGFNIQNILQSSKIKDLLKHYRTLSAAEEVVVKEPEA